MLSHPTEEGGITINNEKDIICQKEGVILIRENEVQVDFTSGEITDLKQKLEEANRLNEEVTQVLERVFKDKEEKEIAIIFLQEEIRQLTQRITELRHDLEKEMLDKRRTESKCKELERKVRELKKSEVLLINLQNAYSELQTKLGNESLLRAGVEQDLENTKQRMSDQLSVAQNNYANQILDQLREIHFLREENQQLNNDNGLLQQIAENEINDLQTRFNNFKAKLLGSLYKNKRW